MDPNRKRERERERGWHSGWIYYHLFALKSLMWLLGVFVAEPLARWRWRGSFLFLPTLSLSLSLSLSLLLLPLASLSGRPGANPSGDAAWGAVHQALKASIRRRRRRRKTKKQ